MVTYSRPYPFDQDLFPPLSDTASLLNDTSVLDLGLEVAGFVCPYPLAQAAVSVQTPVGR